MASVDYKRREAFKTLNFKRTTNAVDAHKLEHCTIISMSHTGQCCRWLLVFLMVGIVGCVSPPRFVKTVTPNPMLTMDGGPMLISNACLQRRVLIGANHFVVGGAELAVTEIDRQLRNWLSYHGIAISGPPLTSVCGVTFESETPMKNYAQVMDGDVLEGEQPLKRSNALAQIAPDAKALGIMLAELQAIALSRPEEDWREVIPAAPISEYSQAVLELLHRASGRSQMLFIGVDGNNESGGKMAAFIGGTVVLTTVAAIVAAPAALGAYTVAQTVSINAVAAASTKFMPISGSRTVGVWVDAARGEIRWTGWKNGGIEPLSPIWLESGLTLTTSAFDPLIMRMDDRWSPPGVKVNP